MPKRGKHSDKASQKKKIQRSKENFETKYALYREKKTGLRKLIAHEKRLVTARTYQKFSVEADADNAIERELSRIRKKKNQLRNEQFRLYLAAEKERYRARQFHWTWATNDLMERKGLSSRIYKHSDLLYLHPGFKQLSCGDLIDSIELVPEDFYIFDWFGIPFEPHGLGYNITEKPDHEHYSVKGSDVDVSISNTSSFEIENPLIRCIDVLGGLAIDGLISPEDDYGMLRIIKEVQLVQYRIDKPIEEIDFTTDEPHCIFRSECGPWYRRYFPETAGVADIGETTSSLNIVISDIAVGDKFFLAQYVKIESENATVFFEHPNGTGLIRMPHPIIKFYGY